MPAVNLFSGSSSGETCYSALSTNTFYLTSSGIGLGVTAFTDVLSASTAPDGFYSETGYRPIWGEITGGGGVFSTTGICYVCSFTGTTTLEPQLTSFVDCCNPGHYFNIIHELTTFNIGEVYQIESNNFSGCATVVATDTCYPVYSSVCGTLVSDCETCLNNNSITCPDYVCEITRIVINTAGLTSYDGVYVIQGSEGYNNYSYFVGESAPNRVIYFDNLKWCLSDTLGGDCLLFGNEQCHGNCPDFCDIDEWVCTTTTANPCDIVDFDALFECDPTSSPTPTPTLTPTNQPTPTPSITPTSTCICCSTSMSLSGSTFGPLPSPTPTPSVTPPPCFNDSDGITHQLISSPFECLPQLG